MNTSNRTDLVDAYGSPLHLYELSEVDAAAKGLRQALPEPSTLYYSLKANPHPLVAKSLRLAVAMPRSALRVN
ncbi:hypothetical protein [Streptomyces sp. NPDC001401]|uniref:hypothetical protein n=1 Tax=Streptomyces sp. NPDC001401 TaxID=3364570 RepID=UPI0036B2D182